MLPASDINAIIQGEIQRLRLRFGSQSAFDLADGRRAEEARKDRIAAAGYALVASRGLKFDVGPSDRERLTDGGLSERDIDEIQPLLAGYVEAGLLPPPAGKITRLLRERGIPDTDANRAQAEGLYLRAMSIALRGQADIFERGSFADDAEHLRKAAFDSVQLAARAVEDHAPVRPPAADTKPATVPATTASAPSKVSLGGVGDKLVSEKEKFKRWNTKTAEQARQTYALFAKSLGHDNLARVSQQDLSAFKDLLLELPRVYGKSGKDKELTAAQLRAKGAAFPPDQRGLGVDAINRHLNFLSQLFAAVRAQGVVLDPELNPTALRTQESADPMDEVLPWSRTHRAALFAQPPFVGCGGWKQRIEPGDQFYHDGLYWVPIICDYHGLRREEAAGLAVTDILRDEDTGHWAIEVRPNKFRALKRTWTSRRLPVHNEPLRLHFIEYVERITDLGYEALFPDLLPARAGKPLGEQFSDNWAKVERAAFPDGKPEKRAFRSFRHSFNSDLKDAGVSLEMRKELMGHKKVGETEGRYGDRFNMRPKVEAISKLPTVTSNLVAPEINLLPPIIDRKPVRRARRRRSSTPMQR